MKRLVLFCSFMVLSLCMLAQINLNDGNWQCVLNEQFDEGDAYWNWDAKRFLNTGDYSWKSYLATIIPKGEHEVYQFENCRINSADNTMHLVAYYDSACIQHKNFYLPKWMQSANGGKGSPNTDGRLFFSGAMQYYKQRYVKN